MNREQFKDLVTEDGEFWADAVRRLKRKGEIVKVLDICRRKLPLPAAFLEFAIASRKLISGGRKKGVTFEGIARELYEFAAYERFLFATPTVTLCPEASPIPEGRVFPAYNVAELAHADNVRQTLEFRYVDIGYRFLDLLNQTDRKTIVELWGEPDSHADPRALYGDKWNTYLRQFETEVLRENERFFAGLLGKGSHE